MKIHDADDVGGGLIANFKTCVINWFKNKWHTYKSNNQFQCY